MNNIGYIDSHLRALGFKCYDRKPVLSFLTATQAILASRIDPSKFCTPQKKKSLSKQGTTVVCSCCRLWKNSVRDQGLCEKCCGPFSTTIPRFTHWLWFVRQPGSTERRQMKCFYKNITWPKMLITKTCLIIYNRNNLSMTWRRH